MIILKRNAQITETFKLGKEKISVNFDAMKIVREFGEKYKTLAAAEKKAIEAVGKKDSEKIFAAYAESIFAVMDLFFGKEIRERIVAYYENNYIDMTQIIVPYITNNLLPKVSKILTAQRDMLAKTYGA